MRFRPVNSVPLRRLTSSRTATWRLAGLVVLTLLIGLPSTAQAAPSGTCRSTPFRTNTGKRVVYRVPAMVVTNRGTVLAFAERRGSTSPAADTGDNEVVVARSTDRGCHWSAPRVIADQGRATVGNPVPVVDSRTGTVLLFTVARVAGATTARGLHLQRSTDDGRTFTRYSKARLDLTKVKGFHGGLTGPGHAIQLRSRKSPHRGRLVVPMAYKVGNRYGAYGLVSDNHGRTWKVGYDTKTDGRIEGTVAELPSGRVWASYRNRNVKATVGTGRVGAFSRDGGSSLQGSLKRSGLPVVSVQGSSLGLRGRYGGKLLFSAPTGKDPSRRQGMGIFLSKSSGVGTRWGRPYAVAPKSQPAAYSDLAQLTDTTIGILYETGNKTWKERIDFRSLRTAAVVSPRR
jgi:sialidase-1